MDKIGNKEQYATLYLVRHGETEGNIQGIMVGGSDSPLTENGVQQARFLAQEFVDVKFDAAFSSDLGRAQRTAEILLLQRELAINTRALLRERNFGRWEGKAALEYREHNKEALEKFEILTEEQKWTFKADPSMENNDQAYSRLITILREIAAAYLGKTVLIVVHGSIMRAFLIKLGFGTHKELGYGAVANLAYIKLRSDGIDFFIDETKGISKYV